MVLGRIGQAVDSEPCSLRAGSCLKPRGKCRQNRGTLALDEAASRAWIWLGERTIVEASLPLTGLEKLGMVREMRSARLFTTYERDVQLGRMDQEHGLAV
jgi:hypothetical protein